MMTTKEKKMMKKKEVSAIVGLGIVILMVILGEVPHMAEGVTCSPTELAPCLGAISSSSPPSTTCCQKVILFFSLSFQNYMIFFINIF